jgi:hypothetical protein
MTHNMNQLIEKGDLDLTMDETTWPNSSYVDVQGRLQGKKTDKGGQHVLLLDSKGNTYMHELLVTNTLTLYSHSWQPNLQK